MKKQKILVLTGGGDCPGLNAVIRGIHKAAMTHGGYEIYGGIEAFNGLIKDPVEIIKLTKRKVGGIHVKGGTILKTTNKGNPLEYPTLMKDGTFTYKNVSDQVIKKIKKLGFEAVINIGGDGSQKISQALYEKGLNIIGVPKTIDNDLSATDLTFGFSTAVQIATEAFDKLVTTAESHNRVMIMEVMGRDAGWIALHTAIAGGSEICLIPEIPFDIDVVIKKINKRYIKGKGFVNIVISEGAKLNDKIIGQRKEGDANIKLGGVGNLLRHALEEGGCKADIRVTSLGHTLRGGTPVAFDRILATAFGVKAFELVNAKNYGKMVSYTNNDVTETTLKKATSSYNFVDKKHYLIRTAKALGISFGEVQ
ncbi:ATP-dependent 6-phosphofructokinase [Saprospiraceae bacterium]|nr:ATP-dependent 6-phosphofructokinase [Saprospiraceae bacterium]